MLLLQKLLARLNFRFRIIFLALMLLSILGLIFNYDSRIDVRYCFMDQLPPQINLQTNKLSKEISHLTRLEDVLLANVKPTPGKSIFFHETSCHQMPRSGVNTLLNTLATHLPPANLIQLTARQACAIESAALHNPNLSVFVLFVSPVYRDNTTAQPLIDALLAYPNVFLRNLNLWTYTANTPIYEWFKDGELFKSRYVISHISDLLRYTTLWRWGGTYLDMDVIVLRDLEKVPPNYTGAESDTYLAAGIMNFAEHGFGHYIAEQCLLDLEINFDGSNWGNNGPGVITRVIQSVCDTKQIELMNRKRCMGFQVFNRDAFYAIPWVKWEYFFEAQYLEETLNRTQNSYVVHVWNKHSHQRRVKVGSKVAYGKLAEKHCPRVYSAAGEFF